MTRPLITAVLAFASLAFAEFPPDKSRPCFPGAIYRKAVSSVDAWTGIDAVVTLPTFVPDQTRLRPTGRPADNCSVYFGGRAGNTEIDAGVLWEVIRQLDGSVSKVGKAYRPFWRNKKWFNAPAEAQYYYDPGDTIRVRVWTDAPDKLKMQIDLIARRGEPIDHRRPPISTLSVDFDAPGFGPGRMQEFKRVTAIDQAGNEGKPAQPTRARVEDCAFRSVHLLRGEERLPMTAPRFTDMRCPDHRFFTVADSTDDGGERIGIDGSR